MQLAPGILRLKYLLATRGAVLSALLVALAAVTVGGAVLSAADPPTEIVTDQEHEQTVETAVHTRATVTGETSLYRRGRTLEDAPVYLFGATPNLTVSVETNAPPDHSTQVEHRVQLVYRASRGDEVFWKRSRTVANANGSTTDGSFSTTGSIDVRSVRAELRRLNTELGSAGTVDVVVSTDVTYDTGRYEGSLSARPTLHISDTAYWLGDDARRSETHSTSRRRERVDPDRSVAVDLPGDRRLTVSNAAGVLLGAGLASLLTAIVVAFYYRRGPGARRLEERLHEMRYAEWISEGRLPAEGERRAVEIHSLEDLVDVGIDTSNRTIYDPDVGRYAVLDGDVRYYFEADGDRGSREGRGDEASRPSACDDASERQKR